MLVGDRQRFAIEFELDDEPCGEWLNGDLAYWIGGQKAVTPSISLRDASSSYDRVLWDAQNRCDSDLFSLPGDELIRLLESALYAGDDPIIDRRATQGQWARFHPRPFARALKTYLIENEAEARLFARVNRNPFLSIMLRRGEFDEVIKSTRDCLEELRSKFAATAMHAPYLPQNARMVDRYVQLEYLGKESLREILRRNDPAELAPAVMAGALYEQDRDFIEDVCARLSAHPDEIVRGNSILGLGHIARRFGALLESSIGIVKSGLDDGSAYVRWQAHTAVDDAQHFLGISIRAPTSS